MISRILPQWLASQSARRLGDGRVEDRHQKSAKIIDGFQLAPRIHFGRMERAPFQKRQNPGTKRRNELPVSKLSHIYWSTTASHPRIQHQARSTYKLQIRDRPVAVWKHPNHAKILPNTIADFPRFPLKFLIVFLADQNTPKKFSAQKYELSEFTVAYTQLHGELEVSSGEFLVSFSESKLTSSEFRHLLPLRLCAVATLRLFAACHFAPKNVEFSRTSGILPL